MVRLEVGAGAPSYPQTAKDLFRGVYYEGIHLIVGLFITAFSSYAQMGTLLVKGHIGDDKAEFSFVMRHTAKMLIHPVGGVIVSRTRKEANSGSPNYL